jgi:hypothetical protein
MCLSGKEMHKQLSRNHAIRALWQREEVMYLHHTHVKSTNKESHRYHEVEDSFKQIS